ncbi:MAG: hypothetical protein AAF462_09775, partial [Thermodesulfobacteriota bacterium]
MKERLDEINDVIFSFIYRLLPNIGEDSLLSILITAVIATVLAIIFYILVKVVTKFIEKKIISFQSRRVKSLRLQNQEILTGQQ